MSAAGRRLVPFQHRAAAQLGASAGQGRQVGYEDERFSYLVAVRPPLQTVPAAARVIRSPALRKFEVALPLCTRRGSSGAG
jgi:ribosomal protein RSM22 (predicted rRNA methylase)